MTDLPFEEQDIITKLRTRAEIRRKIGRKADGKEDRIALTCEQAADEIERLRAMLAHNLTVVKRAQYAAMEIELDLTSPNIEFERGNKCGQKSMAMGLYSVLLKP
jgi:hypothetical protein